MDAVDDIDDRIIIIIFTFISNLLRYDVLLYRMALCIRTQMCMTMCSINSNVLIVERELLIFVSNVITATAAIKCRENGQRRSRERKLLYLLEIIYKN